MDGTVAEIIVSSTLCSKPCAKNEASPFVDEEPTSLEVLSIKRNRFSPTRKVEAGIVNTPAISPAAVVVGLPIE